MLQVRAAEELVGIYVGHTTSKGAARDDEKHDAGEKHIWKISHLLAWTSLLLTSCVLNFHEVQNYSDLGAHAFQFETQICARGSFKCRLAKQAHWGMKHSPHPEKLYSIGSIAESSPEDVQSPQHISIGKAPLTVIPVDKEAAHAPEDKSNEAIVGKALGAGAEEPQVDTGQVWKHCIT